MHSGNISYKPSELILTTLQEVDQYLTVFAKKIFFFIRQKTLHEK